MNKLYDAFGELIYALAKADGLIQDEEVSTLKELLSKHPWAKDVNWSFDYEVSRSNDLEDAYARALDTFVEIGPRPEYTYLIDILEQVAEASNGVDENERALIDNFKRDLKERFLDSLDKDQS